MKIILTALALLVTGILAGLIALLLIRGADHVTLEFLLGMPMRAGREGGILPVLISTALLAGGALGFAAPVGIATALYLQVFAKPGRLIEGVRVLTEALAGIPSILFGLFGFSLFVVRLGWGWSLLSGSITMALMLLPTLIRTTEEALVTVPGDLQEAAVALGATREQLLVRVLLPGATPGILSGVVLAIGRTVGETAALLLTAGSSLVMPHSPLDPSRTMAVHLYIAASEGLSDGRAYATALTLVLSVLAVNVCANLALERWRQV